MLKFLFTISLACIFTTAQANQIFALQHNKEGKSFQNELAELNAIDGKKLTTVKLANSYKFGAEQLAIGDSPLMVFYGLIDKSNAQLQIVNKNNLQTIKTIKISPIHDRFTHPATVYKFYYLSPNNKHLFIHTGFKKNQNLTIIDVEKGSISKQIPMSKHVNVVSLSTDKQYLLINNTSRDELTLVNVSGLNVAMTSDLGKYRQYGTIHNDFLYLTKYKSDQKHNKSYWVQALNLLTQEKVDFTELSNEQPIFAVSEQTNRLLSFSTVEDELSVLNEIEAANMSQLATFEMEIKAEKAFIDDQFNRLLIRGKNRVATIDLSQLNEFALTKLPFDTVNYLYNQKGDLLYLKEGSGSEVAVIEVKTGRLIERSGTGRQGVKFGQFMASVALAGVTGSTGYMYIAVKYSNTGMTLSQNENTLYVINSKTNDVTSFAAKDLSGRKAIATGGGTFMVHHGNNSNAPLWVFSNKQITRINDQSFEMEQEIEYEAIVGLDTVNDYFIIKTENNIQTYDMKTGVITKQWPMSEANLIWLEN